MEQRQKEYMNKENISPLFVFPEGTVTSGKHLCLFRTGNSYYYLYLLGAFEAQLPVKPWLVTHDDSEDISFASGGVSVELYYVLTQCFLYHTNVTIHELPVIYPTQFMYDNFSEGNTNKAQVFANVTRKIFAELSGQSVSQKTVKDCLYYYNTINGKKEIRKESL